ncbi:hypothetical protein BGW41_003206 [Actinomortierella wolfii]|nr:hypothetical protein BGW41_003206 [Actinomortierella wolfii]
MSGAFIVSNVLDAVAPQSISMSNPSVNSARVRAGMSSLPAAGEAEGRASTDTPWPVKQRRRIDRIRDEKWSEFVKTINDQFEWLETYYQGCVVAAKMQQRHQLEMNDDHQGQQQQQQQQGGRSPEILGDHSSTYNHASSLYTTPEQRRHHDFLSSTPPRRSIFSTPLAASASLNATLFPGGRPEASALSRHGRGTPSKALRQHHHPRSPFRRVSSPGSPMAGQSPRRRTIKVTPRRLRVDTSATARRIGRQKQARMEGKENVQDRLSRLQHQQMHGDGQLSEDESYRQHTPEGGKDAMETDSEDDHSHVVSTPSNRQGQRRQQELDQSQLQPIPHREFKTPLNDTMTPSDKTATVTSSAKRSRSLIQSARTLETTIRSRRTEEAEPNQDLHQQPSLPSIKRSTPGSKARDSLGRISPHYRALLKSGGAGAGVRGDHDTRTESVPGLRRGNHATSTSTVVPTASSALKRDSSSLLDRDPAAEKAEDGGDSEGDESDEEKAGGRHASKRVRMPSFHDSTAPVRFESPEREPNSKSSRLSLEEQRVFGSGRLSRTRTTGGSGYEADLSSRTTPDRGDTIVPQSSAPLSSTRTTAAKTIPTGITSAKGRSTDIDQGHHRDDEEEDAGYDSRMSAATILRSSEAHRDTMRISRIRPSIAESFEVSAAEDEHMEGEAVQLDSSFTESSSATRVASVTGRLLQQNQQQQQQQQRQQNQKQPRDSSSVTASVSRLHNLSRPERTATGVGAGHNRTSVSMDEPTDFHDLHTDLPPRSTMTNQLRQGRSVSSTDVLSTVSATAAARGGLVSRVSNLKHGVLKRSVSAMDATSSTTTTSTSTSSTIGGGGSGIGGGSLTQLKPRHLPLTLPEKRTLGPRRPMVAGSGGGAGSSASQLMSRLLKSGQSLASSSSSSLAADGRTSSVLQQHHSAQSTTTVSTAASTSSSSSSLAATTVARSSTASGSSSSSLTTGSTARGAALTGSSSTLMRPTESSLARTADLQSVKRSTQLGGSTATGSSSTSTSARSKTPNPFTKAVAPQPQPPQPQRSEPVQPTELPEIGSDPEDHDLDGDDPFPPPSSSTLTVAAAVKGTGLAAGSATLANKRNAVAGSTAISATSQGASKGIKSNKDANAGSSSTATTATTLSSKTKTEQKQTVSATSSTLKTSSVPVSAPAPSSSSSSSSASNNKYPEWAQWENLEEAMKRQRHVNPRTIFGSLPELDIQAMFPGSEIQFRARQSSSHWGTADRLTEAEVQKYREEMGWD